MADALNSPANPADTYLLFDTVSGRYYASTNDWDVAQSALAEAPFSQVRRSDEVRMGWFD